MTTFSVAATTQWDTRGNFLVVLMFGVKFGRKSTDLNGRCPFEIAQQYDHPLQRYNATWVVKCDLSNSTYQVAKMSKASGVL